MNALNRDGAMSKILVVDDDRDNAETMAMLMKIWGHEVQIAYDGDRAIKAARDMRPDFVLLDIRLPRMDGYQVASSIRRESAATMQLIAITGCSRERDRRRAVAAGFDHYLLKPVDPDALMELFSTSKMGSKSSVQNGAAREESECIVVHHRHTEITNDLGLHLRAAGKFVQLTQRFQAEVRVIFDGRTANGRSILDLATLAAECGRWIDLEADGADADLALDALMGLIERGFDELE